MWNLNNPFIPILSLPQYFLHCVSNALSLGEVKSQLAAIFPLCHLTCQGTALASPLLWVIPCLAEPAPIRGILWAQSCKKVSRLQISGLSSGTWYRRWRAGGRPTDAQLACAVLGMYETGPDEEYLTYYGIFQVWWQRKHHECYCHPFFLCFLSFPFLSSSLNCFPWLATYKTAKMKIHLGNLWTHQFVQDFSCFEGFFCFIKLENSSCGKTSILHM